MAEGSSLRITVNRVQGGRSRWGKIKNNRNGWALRMRNVFARGEKNNDGVKDQRRRSRKRRV